MEKLFTCYNNGVTAVATESVLADITKEHQVYHTLTDENHRIPGKDLHGAICAGLRHLGKPIFTFVSNERFEKSPWFTGDDALLSALYEYVTKQGGRIENTGFYVPFSNGCELGIHGESAMISELQHVTTDKQFAETFGMTPTNLLAWNSEESKRLRSAALEHEEHREPDYGR